MCFSCVFYVVQKPGGIFVIACLLFKPYHDKAQNENTGTKPARHFQRFSNHFKQLTGWR
jgi:hypothetical protein